MRKRVLFILLVFSLLCVTGKVYAGPVVYFNDSPLKFDVPPQNINGSLLIPLRAIFEALGASVDWNETNKEITAKNTDTVIRIRFGQMQGYKNEIPVGFKYRISL